MQSLLTHAAQLQASLRALSSSLPANGDRPVESAVTVVTLTGACPVGLRPCDPDEAAKRGLACPPSSKAPYPLIVDVSGRICFAPQDLVAVTARLEPDHLDVQLQDKASELVHLLFEHGLLDGELLTDATQATRATRATRATKAETKVETPSTSVLTTAARRKARARRIAKHAAQAVVGAAVVGGLVSAGSASATTIAGSAVTAALAAALPSSLSVPMASAAAMAATTVPIPMATAIGGAVASGAVASGAVASGTVASGAVASGAVASGAVASGAVASGAVASGAVASGAVAEVAATATAANVAALGGVSAGTTLAVTAALGGAALVTAAIVAYKVTRNASPQAMDELAAAAGRVAACRAGAPATHLLRGPHGLRAIAEVVSAVQVAHDLAVRANALVDDGVTAALQAAATAAQGAVAAQGALVSRGGAADAQVDALAKLANALDAAVLDVSNDGDVEAAVAPVDAAIASAEAAFEGIDELGARAAAALFEAERALAAARTAIDVATTRFATLREKQRAEEAEEAARKAVEDETARLDAVAAQATAAHAQIKEEVRTAAGAKANEQKEAQLRVLQARLQAAIQRKRKAEEATRARQEEVSRLASMAATKMQADEADRTREREHAELMARDADAAWRLLLSRDDDTVVTRLALESSPRAVELSEEERAAGAADAARLIADAPLFEMPGTDAFVSLDSAPALDSFPALASMQLLRPTTMAPASANLQARALEATLLSQLYRGPLTWPAESAASMTSMASTASATFVMTDVAREWRGAWDAVYDNGDADESVEVLLRRGLTTVVHQLQGGMTAYVEAQAALRAHFLPNAQGRGKLAPTSPSAVAQWRVAAGALLPRCVVAIAAASGMGGANDTPFLAKLGRRELKEASEEGGKAALLFKLLLAAWACPVTQPRATTLSRAASAALNALEAGLGDSLPNFRAGSLPHALSAILPSAATAGDVDNAICVLSFVTAQALHQAVAQLCAVAAQHAQPMPLDAASMVAGLAELARSQVEPRADQITPAFVAALPPLEGDLSTTPLLVQAAACASVRGVARPGSSKGWFAAAVPQTCEPRDDGELLAHIQRWELPLAPLVPLGPAIQAALVTAVTGPRPLLRALFAHVVAAIHGYTLREVQLAAAPISLDTVGAKNAAAMYGAFADEAFRYADGLAAALGRFATVHLGASAADATAYVAALTRHAVAHARRVLRTDASQHAPTAYKAVHLPGLPLVRTLQPDALASIDDAALAHALATTNVPPPAVAFLHTLMQAETFVTGATTLRPDGDDGEAALARLLPRLRARQQKRAVAEWRSVTHDKDTEAEVMSRLAARYASTLPCLALVASTRECAGSLGAWRQLQLGYSALVAVPETGALYLAAKNAQHEHHRGIAVRASLPPDAWRPQDAAFLRHLGDFAAMAAATTVQVGVERAGRGALPFDMLRQLLDLLVLEDCSQLSQSGLGVWEGGATDLVHMGADGVQICGSRSQADSDGAPAPLGAELWQRRADTWLAVDAGVRVAAKAACRKAAVYNLFIGKRGDEEGRKAPFPYQVAALGVLTGDAARFLQAFVDLGHSTAAVRELVDEAAGDVTPTRSLSQPEKAALFARAVVSEDAARAGATDLEAIALATERVADTLVGRAVAAGCLQHVIEHSGMHLGLLPDQLPRFLRDRVEELRVEAERALDELVASGPHGASARLQAMDATVRGCHTWLEEPGRDGEGARVEYAEEGAYPFPTISWGLSRRTLAVALAACADKRAGAPRAALRVFELAVVGRGLLREVDLLVSAVSADQADQAKAKAKAKAKAEADQVGGKQALCRLATYLDLVYRGLRSVADEGTALRVVGQVGEVGQVGQALLPAARGYATFATSVVQLDRAWFPSSAVAPPSVPAAYRDVAPETTAEAAYMLARVVALSAGAAAEGALSLSAFREAVVAPWAPSVTL